MIQLIDEVREHASRIIEIHPEYATELSHLSIGKWVEIDQELDFILETELRL